MKSASNKVKPYLWRLLPRDWRTPNRLIPSCVDVAAKELIHALLEKYALEQDIDLQEDKKVAGLSARPDPVVSQATNGVVYGVVVEAVSALDLLCCNPLDRLLFQ